MLLSKKLVWLLPLLLLATTVSSQEFVSPEIDDIASDTNVSLVDELEPEIVVTSTNLTTELEDELVTIDEVTEEVADVIQEKEEEEVAVVTEEPEVVEVTDEKEEEVSVLPAEGVVEEEVAEVTEEKEEIESSEPAAAIIAPKTYLMRLADFKLVLRKNSEGYIEDLGLSNYLYDKMKSISPDLESVELKLVEYKKYSFDVTYEGSAVWTTDDEDYPSVIAAPFNALLDIDDQENYNFTSFTAKYNVLDVEHYNLTESMLHEMQIAILKDFRSIQDYWETYDGTIGKNLYVESLEVESSVFTEQDDMPILLDDGGLDKWVIPVIISAAVTVCALILWFMPKGGL